MDRMGPVAWGALVAMSLGCSTGAEPAGAKGVSGAGGASSGTKSSATSASVATSSATSSVVATTGAGGGGAFVCDPPADPSSLYALSAPTYADVEPLSMCRYRGDVLLIVNTAAL